jgi:hypothetical protein
MIRPLTVTAFVASLFAIQANAQLSEYTAHYAARYKGRNVGDSVFALQFDEQLGRYVFSSTLRAKGLLRLISPGPVVDRSEFRLEDSAIVPQRFVHEDGSRKGEDSYSIAFDWEAASATVTGADYSRELPLERGMLDRGSLQVELIRLLTQGEEPSRFAIVDDESVDEYTYSFEGRESVETGLGDVEVVRYRQQRPGSSREMLIDLAPSLGYIPARIEQLRDGESQSTFTIESIDRP